MFPRTTALARELGLYGAGKDLLSDALAGNLRGMGPGYAELEFEERPSETVLGFSVRRFRRPALAPDEVRASASARSEPLALPHS